MISVDYKIVSSLEKVFYGKNFNGKKLEEISALRGERVNFQIAVRCDECAGIRFVPDVPEGFNGKFTFREVQNIPSLLPCTPDDTWIISSEPGFYPDALVPITKELDVAANCWHAVWVSVDIPEDAAPGTFQLKIKLQIYSHIADPFFRQDTPDEKEAAITLTVSRAALPKQMLKVTHWFYADCIQHHYQVPAWSEEHWLLLEKYFRNYAEHHNNMLLTPLWSVPLDIIPDITRRPVCQLLEISRADGRWHFDFSRLERWITTAQRCGIRYFEMVHAFSQWGLKYAPEIIVDGQPMFGTSTPSDAPEYADFLRALMQDMLPVLQKHGLTPENCYFHISDEPHGEEALNRYRYAAGLFRKILQGYPYIDALSDVQFSKQGLIDRPIPTLWTLDEFLQEKTAERWTYFAGSQEGMPARQFGMPSIRNRILGILLYIYDCKGFLEWGYNFWFGQFSRTLDVDVWVDSNSGRSFRSGGAYLVYPSPDGPVDSLRHEVVAEAFQDEIALRLLESKTSRESVLQWLEQEAGYRLSMQKYPREDQWLLGLRRKLNTKLAEVCA